MAETKDTFKPPSFQSLRNNLTTIVRQINQDVKKTTVDSPPMLESFITEVKQMSSSLLKEGHHKAAVELVDNLTSYMDQYNDPSSEAFFELDNDKKLNIVWDLDLCLLKSVEVSRNEDPSLHTCVVETFGGPNGKASLHVDDDLYRYKTYLRGWSRFILAVWKPFVNHYVFTSATKGYMMNVVALIEGEKPYNFFIQKQLSKSHFDDKRHLKLNGKSILEFGLPFERTILIDDQPRYHSAQPFNGILINVLKEARYDLHETELLNMMPLILQLILKTNPEHFLEELKHQHTDKYWFPLLENAIKISEIPSDVFKELSGDVSQRKLWKLINDLLKTYLKDKLNMLKFETDEKREDLLNNALIHIDGLKEGLIAQFEKKIAKMQDASSSKQI